MRCDSEVWSECCSKFKIYSGLDLKKEPSFLKIGTYLWNDYPNHEIYLTYIVMTALTAPLFRTWSPISDLQRMSVRAFDDQVKETPICKRRVRRIASVYHADNSP